MWQKLICRNQYIKANTNKRTREQDMPLPSDLSRWTNACFYTNASLSSLDYYKNDHTPSFNINNSELIITDHFFSENLCWLSSCSMLSKSFEGNNFIPGKKTKIQRCIKWSFFELEMIFHHPLACVLWHANEISENGNFNFN